jgi:hypothetical protein
MGKQSFSEAQQRTDLELLGYYTLLQSGGWVLASRTNILSRVWVTIDGEWIGEWIY